MNIEKGIIHEYLKKESEREEFGRFIFCMQSGEKIAIMKEDLAFGKNDMANLFMVNWLSFEHKTRDGGLVKKLIKIDLIEAIEVHDSYKSIIQKANQKGEIQS